MKKLLTSPLKYIGGKTKLAPKLLPLIPEHKTYVEVFAGSAALFFAKERSKLEIINDLDSDIFNFYTVLQDEERFDHFRRLVSLTPYSREVFDLFKKMREEHQDDIRKAHCWFVLARLSAAGRIGGSFGISVKPQGGKHGASGVDGYLGAIERLPYIHERLMGVQIEYKDFREVIRKYDSPETFFYLDPPYVLSTRNGNAYKHEMTDEDHEDLVKILLQLKGKAMLSGYRNSIYKPLEDAGWGTEDFGVHVHAVARNGRTGLLGKDSIKEKKMTRTERIWIKN